MQAVLIQSIWCPIILKKRFNILIFFQKVDFSAAPLTITSERLEYIDFSKPFMQFSMDITSQKPKTGDVDILAFMMPYSTPVWLMTLACLAFVTIMMTLINHFSPFSHK